MNYAVIGCGVIGRRRVTALPPASRAIVVCDTSLERAQHVAQSAHPCRVTTDYRDAVTDPNVQAVVVATINATLAEITAAAIRAGRHVLVEKPAAVSVRQVVELIALAETHNVCVRVGFNHRYHPAIRKARELFESGAIGDLMFIRARYGHGGRPGYEREWRADPQRSGGGELMDQGVHLVDLAGWFLGEFPTVEGHTATFFWNMPVEDNAFLNLSTAQGKTAWLHVSCTEWKNVFSFEIYGHHGKLQIEGLGGSYGVERLYYYRMLPEMGPPETLIWEFPRGDDSWQTELRDFERDILQSKTPTPGLREAKATLEVVERIYSTSACSTLKTKITDRSS